MSTFTFKVSGLDQDAAQKLPKQLTAIEKQLSTAWEIADGTATPDLLLVVNREDIPADFTGVFRILVDSKQSDNNSPLELPIRPFSLLKILNDAALELNQRQPAPKPTATAKTVEPEKKASPTKEKEQTTTVTATDTKPTTVVTATSEKKAKKAATPKPAPPKPRVSSAPPPVTGNKKTTTRKPPVKKEPPVPTKKPVQPAPTTKAAAPKEPQTTPEFSPPVTLPPLPADTKTKSKPEMTSTTTKIGPPPNATKRSIKEKLADLNAILPQGFEYVDETNQSFWECVSQRLIQLMGKGNFAFRSRKQSYWLAYREADQRVFSNAKNFESLVKALLQDPNDTWHEVDAEDTTIGSIPREAIIQFPAIALLWAVALREHQYAYKHWFRAERRYQLTRWPNLDSWESNGGLLKLSSLFTAKPYSISMGVRSTGLKAEQVCAFIHACETVGIGIETHMLSTEELEALAARKEIAQRQKEANQSQEPEPQPEESSPEPKGSGLFNAIKNRFRK